MDIITVTLPADVDAEQCRAAYDRQARAMYVTAILEADPDAEPDR